MRLNGLRLADLHDSVALRALVAQPESESLERKRQADTPTLLKAISGMANAGGGWLVLGVDDDGSLYGWEPKGRAHLRDWLRDKLDGRLDHTHLALAHAAQMSARWPWVGALCAGPC